MEFGVFNEYAVLQNVMVIFDLQTYCVVFLEVNCDLIVVSGYFSALKKYAVAFKWIKTGNSRHLKLYIAIRMIKQNTLISWLYSYLE